MFEDTGGFVAWEDVAADVIQGERATFYGLPTQLKPGSATNAERLEVASFRAGRVSSARDRSAKVLVEYVPRGGRKGRVGVQRSRPTLVILAGWGHPDAPTGWVQTGRGVLSARHYFFAPEWRTEMDDFLARYLREHPDVLLADFREQPPAAALAVSHGEQGAAGLPSEDSILALYPDELDSTDVLTEGAAQSVVVNAYERNPEARRRCIEYFGPVCFVCGFDFARTYGNVMSGYIHVHHLKPLSEIGTQYVIDPVADLRPICPNCHAVVHSRDPPYTPDEVLELLRSAKG